MRVIQILPTLGWGDAVGNDTRAIYRILKEKGYDIKKIKDVEFRSKFNQTIAKEKNTGESLPEVENFIAFQFHEEEHNAARRGRSSKIDTAVIELGVKAYQLLLFDDSKYEYGKHWIQ